MEGRVKRLERLVGILTVALLLLLVFWGGPKLKSFVTGEIWSVSKGVVADEMNTKRLTLMQMDAKPPIPRAILFATDSDTMLSLIDSTNSEMLGIGIRKDPKLGEIPYISFRTKAGVQILEPNEGEKIEWVKH